MSAFQPNNPKHLVTLQGTKYITFVGLQALLIDRGLGLVGTDTEIVKAPDRANDDKLTAIVKATIHVASKDNPDKVRTYRAIGDANTENVGKKLAEATLRMAETRAMSRALRFATRAEFTAIEEIPS